MNRLVGKFVPRKRFTDRLRPITVIGLSESPTGQNVAVRRPQFVSRVLISRIHGFIFKNDRFLPLAAWLISLFNENHVTIQVRRAEASSPALPRSRIGLVKRSGL